ncbi:MAG TPA: hypothetical protein VFP91_01740, partial [Vicinamibacterales bacterium]|nr:hypothetical protein [Vicinamibacterales bacterium]
MTKVLTSVVLTCLVGLTQAGAAMQTRSETAGPPDLHGMWTLNRSLSDKAPSVPADGGARPDGP